MEKEPTIENFKADDVERTPEEQEDKKIMDLEFEINRTKDRISDNKAKGFDTADLETHLEGLEKQLRG